MPICGVIFDLGHTLMHLDGTWPEMFAGGGADLAAFIDEERLGIDGRTFAQALLARRVEGHARARETMREVTAEASMRWTFAQFGLLDPSPSLVKGAIQAFLACEDAHWRVDPAAHAVFQSLADRGLFLGMFSNATDDAFIQRLVERLGLRAWLKPALSSAGVGIRKPDPAALAPFVDEWGLPPDRLVMVGDTLEADVLGAQRAGMRSVWIRSREDARQEGTGGHAGAPNQPIVPDLVLDRLDDLPERLGDLERESA